MLSADVLFTCDAIAIHSVDEHQAPHVLWAPGTPQAVIEEHEAGFATAGADVNTVDGMRWTTTATNGSGLTQGHPSTITWSVVPDGTALPTAQGEPVAGSNLRARLNELYDSIDDWLPVLQQVFDRWEAVSGIDFEYEPSDDGSAYGNNSRGVLGVRGDVRIGGHFIDGNNGVLAYNYFPNHGDMVLDTADSYFSNLSNNSIRLRNTVAHELGHGLGLDHSLPKSGTKLMEPTITTGYDGPQHDDILRVNRGYGDRLEGNDTAATAFDLGALSLTPTVVTDVSIDDDSDVDYFRFTLSETATINLTLSPDGSTYTVGLEDGSNESFDSRAQSDLSLEVFSAGAATVLASANLAGLGGTETLAGVSLVVGEYLVRITGAQNAAQMYTLSGTSSTGGIAATNEPPVLGAIGDRTITSAVLAGLIPLSASDPNGETLTYTVSGQSIEHHLDQTLGLTSSGGNEHFNWGGRGEKWINGAGGAWYYITPDGSLYRWLGGASLANDPVVEQLSVEDYATTALLHNAPASGPPVALSVNGSTLTIDSAEGFSGRFVVTVSVSDGRGGTDRETFFVTILPATGGKDGGITAANQPPVLAAIDDRTIGSAAQNGVISLGASDPNDDPLTYTVTGQSIEYHLDQTLGLESPGGNEYLNWGGRSEKWFTGAGGAWHYITPDGKLYRWLGGSSLASDPLVEQLVAADYANTALVHNPSINSPPAALSVSGDTLTINPDATFRGRFMITVTVSDSRGGSDSETLFVTVL
jgi:hypothetical protein